MEDEVHKTARRKEIRSVESPLERFILNETIYLCRYGAFSVFFVLSLFLTARWLNSAVANMIEDSYKCDLRGTDILEKLSFINKFF